MARKRETVCFPLLDIVSGSYVSADLGCRYTKSNLDGREVTAEN